MTMVHSDHGLSRDQVRDFHEQGVLGPFQLWEPSESDHIRRQLERVYLQGESRHPTNNRHLDSSGVVDLVRRPALNDRVRSLIGEDVLLWRIGRFVKDPGAPEIPWHQDWNYWPIEPSVVVSAWLAVDDADTENSCVEFIPGSHRRMLPHVAMGSEMWFKEGADPDLVPREQARRMILRAGEFVLFNERCLHHSEPNRSQRRRFGLAIRQIPPLTRIMRYDSEHHGVVQISGGDGLGFNRHVEPTPDPF